MSEFTPHINDRHCSCLPCYRKRKIYRYEHDHGLRRMTAAEPSREHLVFLREHGVGIRTISQALGIAELTLMRIRSGDAKMVRKETQSGILAFQPKDADLVPNGCRVDATATRLRYQALIALGYTRDFIAQETGTKARFRIRCERVSRRRALAILDLCRRIGDTPGPAAKAAIWARKNGWRKPVVYDEDLFYDPAWDGTEPVIPTVTSKEQYLREYDHLRWFYHGSVEQVAQHLGITSGYLTLLLSRRQRGLIIVDPPPELALTG
jgi:hypothetical protein